jgi:hypothetical protein
MAVAGLEEIQLLVLEKMVAQVAVLVFVVVALLRVEQPHHLGKVIMAVQVLELRQPMVVVVVVERVR